MFEILLAEQEDVLLPYKASTADREIVTSIAPSVPMFTDVCIVSGCGLDDRANEVRSPAEAKDLSSSHCVQTGSGAHPASCPMGTGGLFPGAKARRGRDADHSPPSSVEIEN
jgi:hypothetical protein